MNHLDELSPEKRKMIFTIILTLFREEAEDLAFYLTANTTTSLLKDIREHCRRSCTAEHCNNCALRKYGGKNEPQTD